MVLDLAWLAYWYRGYSLCQQWGMELWQKNAKSKIGLCVSFDDALIIWAISWSWVFHVDFLKNRFEGQVLETTNLTWKEKSLELYVNSEQMRSVSW